VADHVTAGEHREVHVLHVVEDVAHHPQPAARARRQVDLGDVTVTTILEPKPSRVRNIFICSTEVFCASSRMMNASFNVRPRMKASGATRSCRLHQPRDRVGSTMSCSAS